MSSGWTQGQGGLDTAAQGGIPVPHQVCQQQQGMISPFFTWLWF